MLEAEQKIKKNNTRYEEEKLPSSLDVWEDSALEICLVFAVLFSLFSSFFLDMSKKKEKSFWQLQWNCSPQAKSGIIITLKVYWLPLPVFSLPLLPPFSLNLFLSVGWPQRMPSSSNFPKPDKNLWDSHTINTLRTPTGYAASRTCMCVGGASCSCSCGFRSCRTRRRRRCLLR